MHATQVELRSERRRRHLRERRRRWAAAIALGVLVAASVAVVVSRISDGSRLGLRVRGNQLINASGRPVQLVGVNRSGTEYQCVIGGTTGAGIFSGPSDAASITAMASWHVNAVRVPLNEDCWLGINGVNPAHSGTRYRNAIEGYVDRLNEAGMIAILDLHWNAPGTQLSDEQQVMADADHAPAFWTSVASRFKHNPAVMFDLYNEPNGISWSCWRSGCVTDAGWHAVGMQDLIDTVRRTGAEQTLIVSGLQHANDLSGWLRYPLHDPLRQLVAGVHVYRAGSSGSCTTEECWDRTFVPVAEKVPVVTTEIGERDRRSDFITAYMQWAERQWNSRRAVSFLGWSWDAAQGEGGPSLITSYEGTPTEYGSGFRAYLARMFDRGRILRS